MQQIVGGQVPVAEDPGQQERDERNVLLARDLTEQVVEVEHVTDAIEGPRLHPAEQDPRAAGPGARDDVGEIRPDDRQRDALQAVVPAKLDDEDRRILGKRGVEPRAALRSRVAPAAGVLHDPWKRLRSQPPLQRHWKRENGSRRERETVAQHDDAGSAGRR